MQPIWLLLDVTFIVIHSDQNPDISYDNSGRGTTNVGILESEY